MILFKSVRLQRPKIYLNMATRVMGNAITFMVQNYVKQTMYDRATDTHVNGRAPTFFVRQRHRYARKHMLDRDRCIQESTTSGLGKLFELRATFHNIKLSACHFQF
uniref:Uncharacterized protein n=1 Tax=Cacopsylla melanoneura TaxID=428564 RepID=A0A8D8V073_9HEMI